MSRVGKAQAHGVSVAVRLRQTYPLLRRTLSLARRSLFVFVRYGV